ncbi:Delta2-dienoyl-CoA-isomerase [Coniophora puteana RWD-64-598 SS2]|uniref:Delta2-dienoyl-CoA-isomerase n=1 Tax=Coniophora puteana (strain RWD-64-598) TaxID=741705 RepID=A0A5M3MAI0_CONPW|nr:Delta2-dienoyl-CoA-isomerase [Coniophora puteana RWD-64-598 SS2]EIW75976.1 Delta2-dienoyl-CoA-isomerase [Coniophora puteana RWD-64-598 SS2]
MFTFEGKNIKVSTPSKHVVLVELNRQPVNAFHEEFWTEYSRVFDEISAQTSADIRVVVLSSALPKIFSAGIDFQSLASTAVRGGDGARVAVSLRDTILKFQYAIAAPERCPYPVIVAVHGPVYGLGFDIISACDVRYAASDAKFSIKEVDMGLAADIGSLAHLPKVTGNSSLARELALSARPFSASEAEKLGLVSNVVEGGKNGVVAAALELAKAIASKSPVAVAGTKRLLIHARDHSVAENLEYTATWNSAMLQTSDLAEAVKAGMSKSKEPPNFLHLRRSKL